MKLDDRRAEPRVDIELRAVLKSSQGRADNAVITDLSTGGFAAATDTATLHPRLGYSIKVDGLEAQAAELRWTSPEKAGFAFQRPLHPAVADHLTGLNPPLERE